MTHGPPRCACGYTVPAPYSSLVVLKMLAGLDIFGAIGKTNRIDHLNDLNDTNKWVPLATNTLTSSPHFWMH